MNYTPTIVIGKYWRMIFTWNFTLFNGRGCLSMAEHFFHFRPSAYQYRQQLYSVPWCMQHSHKHNDDRKLLYTMAFRVILHFLFGLTKDLPSTRFYFQANLPALNIIATNYRYCATPIFLLSISAWIDALVTVCKVMYCSRSWL